MYRDPPDLPPFPSPPLSGFHIEDQFPLHCRSKKCPLLGRTVNKVFVKGIHPIFDELVERGTVPANKLRLNTPWGTNEFGFYDPNNNAVFFVEDV